MQAVRGALPTLIALAVGGKPSCPMLVIEAAIMQTARALNMLIMNPEGYKVGGSTILYVAVGRKEGIEDNRSSPN